MTRDEFRYLTALRKKAGKLAMESNTRRVAGLRMLEAHTIELADLHEQLHQLETTGKVLTPPPKKKK